jgi:hypothetical protein
MHKDIPTSKVFYRPIEAAIRWAGLLRYLPMILAAIASPRFLPPSLNCPRWNECRLYSERIYDGILNGELPYGRTASRSMTPKLLQSPDLTVRHVDLKRWMRNHYPEHRPGFLFSRGERMAHPFITLETGQAILVERLALQAALEHAKRQMRGIAGAARHLAQAVHRAAGCQAVRDQRAGGDDVSQHHRRDADADAGPVPFGRALLQLQNAGGPGLGIGRPLTAAPWASRSEP